MEKTNEQWQELLNIARANTFYDGVSGLKKEIKRTPEMVVLAEDASWKAIAGIPQELLTRQEDVRLYNFFNKLRTNRPG